VIRSFATVLTIVLLASSSVQSQDLPKFDGVYLGLKDGTFEKLSPFVGQQVIIDNYGATNEATPQRYVAVIRDGVALQSDILSATFFDSEHAESIFIRSRSELPPENRTVTEATI